MNPLTRVALMAPLLLALLACSKTEAPVGTAAAAPSALAASAPLGDELTFAFDGAGMASFPLDPHNSAYAPHHRIMRSIFDSLIVALPGHQFGPWLAERWEITPDGRRYTFHLRQDVQFHDGTHLDAAAVKTNLDRLLDPKNALFAAKDLGSVQTVKVLDPFTVQLDLSTPYAPLLAQLSKSNFGIISPQALARYGDQIASHPVGSGPFKVVSITAGTEVVAERFAPYQWGPAGSGHAGPTRVARLVFKNVPEEATRVAVLQSGQVQVADLVPPQNLVQLRSDARLKILERELLDHNFSLFFNLRRAPWSDVRLRQAVRQAIDLDSAVRTIYLGTAERAWSVLSPGLLGYDKRLENATPFDRGAAGRGLDALGWRAGTDGIRTKDGKRLTLTFIDAQGNREKRLDLLTLLRRQLKDAGIELRVENLPGGRWLERLRTGDYDLIGSSQFSPDPDVLRRIYSRPQAGAALVLVRPEDAELTALLDEASLQTEPAARLPLYAQAQRRILDAVYALPLYVLHYNVVHSAQVSGIAIDQHGFPVFLDAQVPAP